MNPGTKGRQKKSHHIKDPRTKGHKTMTHSEPRRRQGLKSGTDRLKEQGPRAEGRPTKDEAFFAF